MKRAVVYARAIAIRKGNATRRNLRLDDIPRSWSPRKVRLRLEAYFSLLDFVQAERRRAFEGKEPLADRFALAKVEQEVRAGISVAQRWLSRVARQGGRGFTPRSAGRSPAGAAVRHADRLFAVIEKQDVLGVVYV